MDKYIKNLAKANISNCKFTIFKHTKVYSKIYEGTSCNLFKEYMVLFGNKTNFYNFDSNITNNFDKYLVNGWFEGGLKDSYSKDEIIINGSFSFNVQDETVFDIKNYK